MPFSFNDLDSELVAVMRTVERFAGRLNFEPVVDSSKAEEFIEARKRHNSEYKILLAADEESRHRGSA